MEWHYAQELPAHVETFLRSHPHRSIFQSIYWQRLLEKLPGVQEVSWIWAMEGEEVQLASMLVVYRLLRFWTWLYLPAGPLMGVSAPPTDVLHGLEGLLGDLAKQHRSAWTRMELSYRDASIEQEILRIAKKGSVSYQPEASLWIDLTQSEEEVLSQMKQKGRYNIRLAEKKGVEVFGWSYEQGKWNAQQPSTGGVAHPLDAFYRLFQETTQRDGFAGRSKAYYQGLMEILGPSGLLLLAVHEGEVLAGGVFSFYEGNAVYHFGASTTHKRPLMAPYLLQWRAIQESKKRGMAAYDFLGISPSDVPNHPWQHVTEFKKKFGGEVRTYIGPMELHHKPWLCTVVELLKRLRSMGKNSKPCLLPPKHRVDFPRLTLTFFNICNLAIRMKLQHKFYLSLLIFVVALVFALPSGWKTVFEPGQPLGFLQFIAAPKVNLGLDLQGGTQLEYNIDLSRVDSADQKTLVDGVIGVIKKRIDSLGVTEPNVYASDVAGQKHIYVELAGIKDIEQAKNTVGKTIQLEFKEQKTTASAEEKEEIRAEANALREQLQANPAEFASIAQANTEGDRISYDSKEAYKDQLPQFLADKLTTAPAGTFINEVLEGNDGFIFQASTNSAVPYEGFFLVKAVEKVRELRQDPKNAEDFLTVAREVSGATPVEVGYVRGDSTEPYVSALSALETGYVSDVIEGSNAYYILKSLNSLQAEPELRDLEVVKFAKQDVTQLERQLEESEVTTITNQKAAETAREAEAAVTAENFSTMAQEYAQKNPTFVAYTGQTMTITQNDPIVAQEVKDAAFALQAGQVSKLVITDNGEELIYVKNVGNVDGQDTREIEQLVFMQTALPSQADLDSARARNEELQAKAVEFQAGATGENFATRAQELTGDAAITYTDMGYVAKEAIVDYSDAAFGLTDGTISQVVDTPTAYYVIRQRGNKPANMDMDQLQVATICFGEGCEGGRSKEEAKALADSTLERVRMEDKFKYEQVFFSTYPEEWQIAMVDGKALTGEFFQRAEVMYGNGQMVVVNVTFNDEGARMFDEITARNVGKPLAIFVGDEFISSPVIRERISNGQAQISGGFTVKEATELARNLNTGALPAPIELVGQQNIGATLGQNALDMSLKAGILGTILLFLYMIAWYRFPGLLASIALGVYVVIMVALIKLFGVTLTLAGIAAVILSMGFAVDGNVLIFERLREELSQGRDLRSTINTAFDRAWSSIWDANMSSIITALILYYSGTTIMQGFAFMLIMGTLVSMFTAIFVTRIMLLMLARTKWGTKAIRY